MAVSISEDKVIIDELVNPLISNVLDTNSMIPTFDAGDLLILSDPVNLRIGDIVVWQRKPGEPLSCHRIIKIQDHWIKTKGDHNWVADKWVLDTVIRYRVRGIIYRED